MNASQTAEALANTLRVGLMRECEDGDGGLVVEDAGSFADVGILTNDSGFVVLIDGRTYNVTVTPGRSR